MKYLSDMLYHIALQSEWNQQSGKPDFAPADFIREGFIHASYHHQIEGVVDRYYKERNDLLLLHVDERKLTARVVEEPSRTGELFPHIFGSINKDAIVRVESYRGKK
jgi:uncharacterized protein (DUF952 family)